MSVIGIEKLEFGVENIPSCQKFLHDFGLKAASDNASLFTTLSGAEIQLFSHQDPNLPAPFEAGSTLRRITWGVENSDKLQEVIEKIRPCDGFQLTPDGAQCRDPNGMTVAFTISKQKTVELEVTAINQWGDIRRIDKPSPVYEKATPINVGHVVFFVDDLPSTEAFYCQKLGFQVSDRYIDRAVFLRTQINGCHHNLFLLKLPHRSSGLNHVAFTVRDIHEVIGGGLAMNRHQWSTFIGPGRHPISSAYFWYVNSPTGGAFEYYTNDDYLTDKWQPRELEHSLVSFTEWAVEGGLDYETRRQVKE
ncbi:MULTISPECIES: VOC family protein [Providencia]|uniref:VOC family protein n=1 Tax=Providencia rettgeri TaxID=587 RepID=A0AAW6UKJ9_PRORE|nr:MULTISPECIES: VOC family protein [Providencia]MBG5894262.1 VOC family protein [Providencia rettgeri]MCK9790743.1 VOC family protein [Providencia rettgeri]MDI9094109.1 VOC family protein [Providencia rettgeri]MDT2038213.1 VOC family protein [Providencia rettgeri]MDX7424444.1 VOC family protein [Providencia sp. CIM-Carb-044]